MKKYMPLEGLRWSRDSGSTLCDTPQNGRSRTGWGGVKTIEERLGEKGGAFLKLTYKKEAIIQSPL